jgi:hypothetical protein
MFAIDDLRQELYNSRHGRGISNGPTVQKRVLSDSGYYPNPVRKSWPKFPYGLRMRRAACRLWVPMMPRAGSGPVSRRRGRLRKLPG